jgi:hypothetical protein
LTYGLMSVGCFLAGGVTNKITAKWTLFIGAAFYTTQMTYFGIAPSSEIIESSPDPRFTEGD